MFFYLYTTLNWFSVSNLSSRQFKDAENTEEKQRARYGRRQGSGPIGDGYNYGGYPYMVGSMITGSGPVTPDSEPNETLQQDPSGQTQSDTDAGAGDADSGQTANTDDGMGVGGTTAGMVGTG